MAKLTSELMNDISSHTGKTIVIFLLNGHKYEGTWIESNTLFMRLKDYKASKDVIVPWNNISCIELKKESIWVEDEKEEEDK